MGKAEQRRRTCFMLRDRRRDDMRFSYVSRKVYKTAARTCNEAGVPIRTQTKYADGVTYKMLTILQKESIQSGEIQCTT